MSPLLLPHAPRAHLSGDFALLWEHTSFSCPGRLHIMCLLGASAWKAVPPGLHMASSSSSGRLFNSVYFLQSKVGLFVFTYPCVGPHVLCIYHYVPDTQYLLSKHLLNE